MTCPSDMAQKAYAKGRRNEHRSRKILEAAGYTVLRMAGSHGCWDLIGFSATDVVLCQVKSRDWPGTLELEELRSFACPPNCRRIIHRWKDRVPVPDVKEL